MNKKFWLIIIAIIILLLGLGILINIIGGVSIRVDDTIRSRTNLTVTSPLTAGAQTVIHWDTPTSQDNELVTAILRTKKRETILGESPFFAGNIRVTIPCEANPGSASVLLKSSIDQHLLTSTAITITSPGPDCVR